MQSHHCLALPLDQGGGDEIGGDACQKDSRMLLTGEKQGRELS